MSKNIILCSDGTGNKGGYTPDSNVYKIYNAIEIHDTRIPQYTFYDNGVGTSTNKYWRAITGAFGVGIKQNVMDLYTFLALHYEPGDKVFLFGFSRGAATIRAFCGFIACTGLVKGRDLNDDKLKQYTSEAFEVYENHKKDPDRATAFSQHPNSNGIIDIHFVGVWDTVSALGFPKKTDKTNFTLCMLDLCFMGLEKLLDLKWPHNFYRYGLFPQIKNACQALAIDDERTAFWPKVWNEKESPETRIEQVWFSGMHSNVGGGYERQGMANVTLHWMMLRAQDHGLTFKKDIVDQVYADSNIHGRLYNSRDGLAIYYRYHPRNIKKLCSNKLRGNIKIHCSTFERMRKRTGNYAPVYLPDEFEITQSALDSSASHLTIQDPEWDKQRKIIEQAIYKRKKIYGHFISMTLFLAIYLIFFVQETKTSLDEITSTGFYIDFIKHTMAEYTVPAALYLFLAWLLYKRRNYWYHKMTHGAEAIRKIIVKALPRP